ncbi:MAG TPA: hypothetical protein PKA28_15610 [Methylomusa anaerophila]|uniref:Uncharacterized protein n=1 Tax=Methylomusa anaerophila TaxID=1930071 RepID=A0A348AHD9_9FIRM|nr:hypothetical protein [Methylomusa anaerophila]BBB90487.1 hypothetical protein MAMMFC1_01138 [Methylomusa anaerophila]HML89870.1 hypothetical protein [Methylomusa anaerophila]
MASFWYVSDGEVEAFSEQEVDWKNSALVIAPSPEDALIKVMQYNQGIIDRVELIYNGRAVVAIV